MKLALAAPSLPTATAAGGRVANTHTEPVGQAPRPRHGATGPGRRRARGFGLFDDIGRDAHAIRDEEETGEPGDEVTEVDVGVLPRGSSRGSASPGASPRPRPLATCAGESVTCAGGTVDGGTATCAAACGGECCTGDEACEGFSGEVCKDGSCAGARACKQSVIGLVKDGCQGDDACRYVAGQNGLLGEVDSGCNGERACYRTADYTGSFGGGSIGLIQNSCLGSKACYFTAVSEGSIGSIVGSCNAERACESAAANKGQGGGTIASLSGACNGTLACYYLAGNSGNAGDVTDSCNDASACYKA